MLLGLTEIPQTANVNATTPISSCLSDPFLPVKFVISTCAVDMAKAYRLVGVDISSTCSGNLFPYWREIIISHKDIGVERLKHAEVIQSLRA